jgi:ribosome biogenesis GTPase
MTKQDLGSGDDFLKTYKDLDIPVFKTDKTSDLSDLRSILSKKITVLLGHSGVGKSTLVNNLLINSKNKFIGHNDESTYRQTGDVNEVTGRGRHTSSSAIALPISSSFSGENFGWIIDTPGVRSFGVAHVQPSRVIAAFPEFAEPVSMCPKNCSHDEQSCVLNSWNGFDDKNHARLASLRRVLSTK